ncbi:hypothetical protein PRIC1_007267 [Phytophthora ramorum]
MVKSRRTPRRQGTTPLLPAILSPVSAPAPTQTPGTAGDFEVDSEKDTFAWTTLAAKVLLEVRFKDMKSRFQGPKSSAQLSSAWALLASEVSRLSDITVKPTQCKSKIKYMQKQYRAYRAAQQDTEKTLHEPPCYDTMREAESVLSVISNHTVNTNVIMKTNLTNKKRFRLRTRKLKEGKRGFRMTGVKAGAMSDHQSVTNRQTCEAPHAQPNSTNNEILQSLRDLKESVQAQTAVLMLLNDLVAHSPTPRQFLGGPCDGMRHADCWPSPMCCCYEGSCCSTGRGGPRLRESPEPHASRPLPTAGHERTRPVSRSGRYQCAGGDSKAGGGHDGGALAGS